MAMMVSSAMALLKCLISWLSQLAWQLSRCYTTLPRWEDDAEELLKSLKFLGSIVERGSTVQDLSKVLLRIVVYFDTFW